MRIRGLLATALLALPVLVVAPPPADADDTAPTAADVDIVNNDFAPQAVTVAVGGTVTWTLQQGSHTVTASDGAFRHTGIAPGGKVQHTFAQPGTFTYFCEFHGTAGGYPYGMTGVVYVGTAPPPEPEPETRLVPSEQYATVASALEDLPANSTVLVEPGEYELDEELRIEARGATIRPASAGTVAFEKRRKSRANVGLVVAADDVTLRDIEVRKFDRIGVAVDGRRALLERVRVVGAAGGGDHGIRVLAFGSADISAATVTRTDASGLSVSKCRPADATSLCAYIRDGTVTGAGVGVLVSEAQRVHVVGMRLDIDGGRGVAVERSAETFVASNRVVRAGTAIDVQGPSRQIAVVANVLSATLGLRWDGAGADVCFRRNTDATDAAATSDPPGLQALPCSTELREAG